MNYSTAIRNHIDKIKDQTVQGSRGIDRPKEEKKSNEIEPKISLVILTVYFVLNIFNHQCEREKDRKGKHTWITKKEFSLLEKSLYSNYFFDENLM
jgi:hypothetical protein